MRIATEAGLPVIEGTAEELVKLALACVGAIQAQEAVVMMDGKPLVGMRRVDNPDSDETPT